MIARRIFCLYALLMIFAPGFPGTAAAMGFFFPETTHKAVEEKAPDFILKDLTGRSFRLSEQRGKPVLIIFSTTWCNSCRAEIPHFKDIHYKYSRRGVEVINVDIQEPRDRVARFARRYDLPYRTLLDLDGSVAELYSIFGVPTLILIDGAGKIVCWQCRTTEAMLEKILQR